MNPSVNHNNTPKNSETMMTTASAPSEGANSIASAPPTAMAFPAVPTSSLYVGELLSEVDESALFELFGQVGSVASIRVCRDAVTRRSLGYAYVNFHNSLDGERALDTLNYSAIKGKPCRIMWSQRDPSLRRSGHGNVFIKDLEKSIDNKALHDTFSAFGNILSCKVVLDEQGNSKGYGFVHFETQEAADLAIEKVNGMLLNDKKVFVGPHISRRERVSKQEESRAQFTNVYVKNLDLAFTEDQLRDLFSPFGEITSAFIQKDDQGVSKGFGFVNYVDHSSAFGAIETLNGKELSGKEVTVCRAQTKAERIEDLRHQFEVTRQERMAKYQGVNLYVKNLDESCDEEQLMVEFSPYGAIVSCKVMRDEKGVSKGFGFICFSTPEEAAKALAEVNGKLVTGKPIFVAMAQRKEDRRLALESQFTRMPFRAAGMAPHMVPPHMFYQAGFMVPGGHHRSVPSSGFVPPMMYGRPVNSQGNSNSGNSRFPMMRPSYAEASDQLNHQNMRRQFRPRTQYSNPHSSNSSVGAGNVGYQRRPYGQQSSSPRAQMMSMMMGNAHPSNNSFNHRNVYARPYQQRMYYSQPYEFGQMSSAPDSPNSSLAQALASASPESQKTMLGEMLYPLVESRDQANAAKITGMLLDMDNAELLNLLETPDVLSAKVAEALELIQESAGESSLSQ